MELTPFDGGLLPEGSDLRKFTNTKIFKAMDLWCQQHPMPTSLVSGPMGLGKDTLIRYYFSKERCRALAAEKKNLIQPCHFASSQLKRDVDVFLTLIEAVNGSLENLDRESEDYRRLKEDFARIQQKEDYADVRNDERVGRLLLEALTQRLQESDYCVTLILYDFQQLTCSEACAVDTFGAMANLVQKELISYIVIADYSIRVGSENYALSAFERILPDPLILSGVTGKKAVAALQTAIRETLADWEEDEEEPITFTDDELAGLWTLTAGIPGLIQGGLKALYRCRQEDRTAALTWEDFQRVVLSGCRDLMRQWTKHLDQSYWDTLGAILDNGADDALTNALPADGDRRSELRVSGLIARNESTQTWSVICPLFELYLRQELGRPRRQEDDLDGYMKLMKKYGGDGLTLHLEVHQAGEQLINQVSGDYLAGGATKHEQNLQVNAGLISAEEFLDRLGIGSLFGGSTSALPPMSQEEKLDTYRQISDRLHESAESVLAIETGPGDEQEKDHKLDLLIAQTGNEILPDVDPETLEEGRLTNMDQRFAAIRARMGLEAELSDEMMRSLSPLCRFYVEAALVVEDHMESIMFMLKDYSTHLVMYGKCLEQSLRDGLFPVLRTHADFRDYNTYVHRNTPGDTRTFGAMQSETSAMLGSFYYILNERKNQFGALCAQCGVTVPGVVDQPMETENWVQWWRSFAQKVRKAKDIRNRVHAGGRSPSKEDLDELRRATFGMEGVLHLSQVGRTLYERVEDLQPVS